MRKRTTWKFERMHITLQALTIFFGLGLATAVCYFLLLLMMAFAV